VSLKRASFSTEVRGTLNAILDFENLKSESDLESNSEEEMPEQFVWKWMVLILKFIESCFGTCDDHANLEWERDHAAPPPTPARANPKMK
jgi:hypothetical protein